MALVRSRIGKASPPVSVRGHIVLAAALVGLLAAALAARAVWVQHHRAPGNPPRRAFYYWKTQWSTSPVIAQSLAENGISRLYLRFFDVDWDEPAHAGQPVSPLQLSSPLPTGVEVVPVVFVTNRVFHNTPYADVEALADHVWLKVRKMAEAGGIAVREVQLDCDWSDGTRTRYFHFVERLKQTLHARKILVSSTIRLHQVKYPLRTGVPPVDRGMLMFYNFGPLSAQAPRSSIFNEPDAEKYASYVASYSLPLDVALPLFSWTVHSRDGNVLGLIEKIETRDIESAGAFRTLQPGRYQAERSLFFRSRYFMAGDQLLMEETTPVVTQKAAAIAARGAGPNKPYATIAFFDLDERNLRHYAATDFQRILAAFR